MRWTPGGNRGNLEDRRGMSGMGKGLGIGGTVIVLALSLLTGRNLFQDLGVEPGAGGAAAPMTAADSARQEKQVDFVVDVLNDAQNTWQKTLSQNGKEFHPAKLVLFRNSTQSGCGVGQSAMGPFYCPVDEKVYVDLAFYDELSTRFGAKGDFAQAYVLAHELGHHVQHLVGTDAQVRSRQESNPDAANELSVRLELQADCYAGVWGHDAASRGKLDPGDVEEALGAASAVGDDRIQQQTQGRVNVDAFTHGSAAQRAEWYKRGMESGDMRSCDTFQ
ncbi:MAG: zinc metallopeptidase [Gemmatimonadaceae bacterium]|nr:zinc metallopeptidase [Gemmatimonadaceae bacterium]